LRRLLLHEKIADEFLDKMIKAYSTIKVGDALEEGKL